VTPSAARSTATRRAKRTSRRALAARHAAVKMGRVNRTGGGAPRELELEREPEPEPELEPERERESGLEPEPEREREMEPERELELELERELGPALEPVRSRRPLQWSRPPPPLLSSASPSPSRKRTYAVAAAR
jgi:hypothetical protein